MPFIKGNKLGRFNKGRKGQIPWNKGLKTGLVPKSAFKKGDYINEKHPLWKGKLVSYVGLHQWVRRKLGKPKKCSYCKKNINIQWANKSHEYKRDLDDWIALCRRCHMIYDNIMEKAWITRKNNL